MGTRKTNSTYQIFLTYIVRKVKKYGNRNHVKWKRKENRNHLNYKGSKVQIIIANMNSHIKC